VRRAGLWAVWLGVEDMAGTLINKGQRGGRTIEAFRLLRANGIFPVPMLMHHDAQPLYTHRTNDGLINQLRLLRRAGAVSMQVTALSPAVGSRSYEDAFRSGLAFRSVGGVPVEARVRDGNHVVASHHPRPWRQQLNVLAAYVYFYSPLRFLAALVRPKTRIPLADAEPRPAWTGRDGRPWHTPLGRRIARKVGVAIADACVQLSGMFGLVYTVPNVLHWCVQLRRGRIERYGEAPTSVIPMRAPDGTRASHALPGTPVLSV